MQATNEKRLGGYLKINISSLRNIVDKFFPDQETTVQVCAKLNSTDLKHSKPYLVKWETLDEIMRKHRTVFKGIDMLFHQEEFQHEVSVSNIGHSDLNVGEKNQEKRLFSYIYDCIFIFQCFADDVLTLQIVKKKNAFDLEGWKEKEQNQVLGFCSFPLKKIVSLPKIIHEVELIFINPKAAKFKMIEPLLRADSEFVYLTEDIGTIDVKIVEAHIDEKHGKKIKGVFGSLKPLVVISIGDQEFETKTDDLGYLNPIWNESKEIEVIELQKSIKFSLLNQNMTGRKEIGSSVVDLLNEDLLKYSKGKHEKIIKIFDKKQEVGTIKIESRFRLKTA